MGTNLADFDNKWYKPGSFIRRFCWYITSILFFKNALFPFYKFKLFLLRLFGAKAGKNIVIKPGVNIKYPWFLELGNHVWIGENVWIDNLAKVRIGNNVCLSQGCLLLTGNHDYNDPAFKLIIKGIDLEDGVWIGARATVCGGSICREHSVLSVGSVAVGELESKGIYRGNPAIKIKDRTYKKIE